MFVPSDRPNDELLHAVVRILQQASEIIQQEYLNFCQGEKFHVQTKHDDSPVTQADLKANQFIETALQELTPTLPLLSEENEHHERHNWSRCWLLDPLDGTKEFLHQRPEFTINLSQIEQGKTLFSAIAIPAQKLIYIGYIQQKPYKYDVAQQRWFQYQPQSDLLEPIHVGLSHRSHKPQYQQFIDILQQHHAIETSQAGSAYKFCMMLEGKIDLYPRFHPTSEWDTSAGQGLLESIGGGLVSLAGEPFIYNQRSSLLNHGFIAFSQPAYQEIALNALRLMTK
ncbi:3'(2'),5'-bisphosphate nucleotidase CysQ family protein [Acinetobacter sp. ANC 4641]|uniref:3'(2'),5'-bisphosphate nucleotidase CysQ family protein n=1 Tax=Acinetobacter sp. ANC 4641 TaxID=2529847 RepID=UPI00103DCD86|nr:3'(2'),5'-bisphosphate nucleotidase CysQ [Acinetobacter sp. ANC 4641]TCB12300.1 3'(2'),5'-bisphosphate nucleotidase CysQ [Acinetobacter sp. ANC 4641]